MGRMGAMDNIWTCPVCGEEHPIQRVDTYAGPAGHTITIEDETHKMYDVCVECNAIYGAAEYSAPPRIHDKHGKLTPT